MPSFDLSKKLPLNFYHQDLLTAAQKLLGKILVRKNHLKYGFTP